MPLLSPDRVPKYRRHKQSGQARVLLKGQHFLLGPYGSNASRRQYNRLITEWLANGQQVPAAPTGDLTVTTLINRFWEHAKTYYRNADGSQGRELLNFKQALTPCAGCTATRRQRASAPSP